jgi:hypothetical protein
VVPTALTPPQPGAGMAFKLPARSCGLAHLATA